MADLYFEMTDEKFNKLATTSITNWWNDQNILVNKSGHISPDKICVITKELFRVARDKDELYFKFVYHEDLNRCCLTIYEKQDENIIKL